MKKKYNFINITAIFLIVSMNTAFSQWQQCNGPYGGNLLSISVTDSLIFAGTSGLGLFYSADGGNNWINTSLNDKPISAILAKGADVFAGTTFDGLSISRDNGTTWQNGIFAGLPVYSLLNNGQVIYAAVDSTLYVSANNGKDWELENLLLTRISSLAKNSTMIFAACSAGVFSKNIEESNWSLEKIDNLSPLCLATRNNTIFAGTMLGLYRKLNAGASWQKTALSYEWVTSIAIAGNIILAGTINNGVFASTNLGETWSRTSLKDVKVNCIAIYDSVAYAGITGKPLYKAKVSEIVKYLKTGISETGFPSTGNSRIELISHDITNGSLQVILNSEGIFNTKFEIYDIAGCAIYSTECSLVPGENTVYAGEFSELRGAYFIRLSIPGNTAVFKLISAK